MPETDLDITIYRADWVLPVAAPVLPDGGVAVAGGRILAVGPAPRLVAEHPDAAFSDLGRAIIMPGFVNCHSHVEYTSFRGILDDAEFGDWIISLVDVKASLTPDEYLVSARLGAMEAISSGITTIADTSYGAATLEAGGAAGLRGRVYLEVFGVDDSRFDETMADVVRRLDQAQAAAPDLFDVGLAPHAPYTVSSRLYQAVCDLARERGLKVMSHVAESQDELTYIRSGSGKFAHDYREKMGWERMLVQPYGVTPIKICSSGACSTATSSPSTASTSPATTSASCATPASRWRTVPRATPSSGVASRRSPTFFTRACAWASAPTVRRRATSWTCSTRCAPCCSCTAPWSGM